MVGGCCSPGASERSAAAASSPVVGGCGPAVLGGASADGATYALKTISPVHCPPVRTVSDAVDVALPSTTVALIDTIWSSGSGAS